MENFIFYAVWNVILPYILCSGYNQILQESSVVYILFTHSLLFHCGGEGEKSNNKCGLLKPVQITKRGSVFFRSNSYKSGFH